MTMEGPIGAADRREIVPEQPPLAYPVAVRALAGCFVATARLVRQRRMHLPCQRVGMRLRFADGTSARVFRETIVDRGVTADPCVLAVEFRLRAYAAAGMPRSAGKACSTPRSSPGSPASCRSSG